MKYFHIKCFVIFISLIFVYNHLFSQDEGDSTEGTNFEEFLKLIYQSNDVQVNNNYLNISYGPSSLFAKHNIGEKLSGAFNLKVDYGFLRISPTENDFILYLGSEGAYLGNVSSHLKPRNWKNSGLLFDSWAFGFNYKNGYGYNFENEIQLYFIHNGSLDWKKIDFETFSQNEIINKSLLSYNQDFRFGASYESEIRAILSNFLMFQLSYSESHLFRRHLLGAWTVSALIELVLQRGIDYFSPMLIQSLPVIQPVLNLAIKTFISSLIYGKRQNNSYFPFESEPPLRFENIRFSVGLSF